MHASPFPPRTIFDQTESFHHDFEHKLEEFDDLPQPGYMHDGPFTIKADEQEMTQLLQTLHSMRQDGALCDIVINVSGTRFPAHKAVLCGCSRWLRSLIEHEEQEIQLDMLNAQSFEAILNYIYAQPVEVNEENVDALLSIARRLGLQRFEEQCWSFLLMIANPHNCMKLHELADKYECAPLKLRAWKMIQESYPGYAVAPARLLETKEMLRDRNGRQEDESSLGDEFPSIFAALTEEDMANYVPPWQLPEGAPAETVVKSWAIRLQLVWQECHPGTHEYGFSHGLNVHQSEMEAKDDALYPHVDYHEELTRFYMVHNPDKLQDVPDILTCFIGKEEEMLLSLYQKYGVELPPNLEKRIEARHGRGGTIQSPYAQSAHVQSPYVQSPTMRNQFSSPGATQPFSSPVTMQQQQQQQHPSGTGIEQFRRKPQTPQAQQSQSGPGMPSKPSSGNYNNNNDNNNGNNMFDIDVDQTVETSSVDGAQPRLGQLSRAGSSGLGWNKSMRSMHG